MPDDKDKDKPEDPKPAGPGNPEEPQDLGPPPKEICVRQDRVNDCHKEHGYVAKGGGQVIDKVYVPNRGAVRAGWCEMVLPEKA